MKRKTVKAPRHIVVDTETGEVVGVARKSFAPTVVVTALLVVAAVCVCVFVFLNRPPAEGPEESPGTAQQDFLENRAEAWENAEEGVTYFVDDDGNWVFIPEKYRDNPQEWIDQVGK